MTGYGWARIIGVIVIMLLGVLAASMGAGSFFLGQLLFPVVNTALLFLIFTLVYQALEEQRRAR